MGEEQPLADVSSRRHFTKMLKLRLHLPCTDRWRTGGNPQSSREKSSSAQSSPLCQCFQKGTNFIEFSPRKKCQSRHVTITNKNRALICSDTLQLPRLDELWLDSQRDEMHSKVLYHPQWQTQTLQASHSGEAKFMPLLCQPLPVFSFQLLLPVLVLTLSIPSISNLKCICFLTVTGREKNSF